MKKQEAKPRKREKPKKGTAKKEIVEKKIKYVQAGEIKKTGIDIEAWQPKTSLGKKVKAGEIKSLSEILDSGQKILEAEIIDVLLPDLEADLLLVGQAKGKFGGGQRRVFKQTQKKSAEGNKPQFSTLIIVGNKNGFLGLGSGKARETVPAREKAMRKSKLNIMKIIRGCGSWQCSCAEPHSIPFTVEGKCGSVKIKLMPAPKGTGLCVEEECKKMLAAAGIRDIWSKTKGKTSTKTNLINACFSALKKLSETKTKHQQRETLGMVEGEIKEKEEAKEPAKEEADKEDANKVKSGEGKEG